jgi:2-oxo-4-hydroxy-4-carboxy-5-ureidoimidazoline decarboxylase
MTDIATFDRIPEAEASELLRACCGATRWGKGMLARRPFGTRAALLAAADEVWLSLDQADWREAFDHHPRLGETGSATAQGERARSWSAGEQAGLRQAAADQRAALARANAEYERRFGYICIICATGLGPAELLTLTTERLTNPPDVELGIAVEEQRKITRLRLHKLFHDASSAAQGGHP